MMRVRCSTLEEFRWLTILDDADRERELIARVQGRPAAPRWQMERGTAWHACLAGEGDGAGGVYGFDGWTFDAVAVEEAKKYVGPGLFEVTGRRIFDLGRESIEVQGTCDWISGLLIQDNKTKCSTPDARDYEASLQWRFYLLIHGADCFRYNLWDFADPDTSGFSRLKDAVSFNFFSYPGMEQDCREWLCRFLEWCDHHSLIPYLERSAS